MGGCVALDRDLPGHLAFNDGLHHGVPRVAKRNVEVLRELAQVVRSIRHLLASLWPRVSKEAQVLASLWARVSKEARVLASLWPRVSEEAKVLASLWPRVGKEAQVVASLWREVSKEAKLLASLWLRASKEAQVLASLWREVSKEAKLLASLWPGASKEPQVLASLWPGASKKPQVLDSLWRRASKSPRVRANNPHAVANEPRVGATNPRADATLPHDARSFPKDVPHELAVVCSKPPLDLANLRERTYRTMATPTEKSVVAELTALAEGLEKNLPNKAFVSASQSYTGPEVIAQVRAILAAGAAVIEARGTLTDALRENRKMQEDKAEFLGHLRDTLRSAYSNDQVTLAEFGLAPKRTRGAPTGDELLLRVTKSKATRKERRTMGKRQKAAIKGNVTGVMIIPTVKGEEGEG